MSEKTNRREFVHAAAWTTAGLAAGYPLPAAASQASPPPRTMGAKLRELLESGQTFEHVAAYDVLTARMVELFGFPSIYLGGSAMAEFYGEPGWSLTSLTERIQYAGHIASRIDVPCIADIDEAGNPLILYRATKDCEKAGVAGIHFVDGAGVTRMTGLLPVQEMVDRIRAATDARSDLIVTVRCQGLNVEGMERTLERGVAYVEAGADAIWFVPMPLQDQHRAAAAVGKPLMAQLFYDQPISMAAEAGVIVAVYASLVQNIAQSAVYDALMELRSTGTWMQSAKGQRLGNTIPADFRSRMLRMAEHTARATRYNVE